ncbi:uncharacterized protein LOC133370691 isoform X2 [Rhineura floridana]|nr:uncharacterized protein LOC133370691 isoform X2 [Rhineura floridana]
MLANFHEDLNKKYHELLQKCGELDLRLEKCKTEKTNVDSGEESPAGSPESNSWTSNEGEFWKIQDRQQKVLLHTAHSGTVEFALTREVVMQVRSTWTAGHKNITGDSYCDHVPCSTEDTPLFEGIFDYIKDCLVKTWLRRCFDIAHQQEHLDNRWTRQTTHSLPCQSEMYHTEMQHGQNAWTKCMDKMQEMQQGQNPNSPD